MAFSKRSFKMFVVEEFGGFPHFLLMAILEWILIASLYLDGFLAFLSSTFAKICELEPPCVLCTRVDHALMCKEPNTFYNDSICECHKKDISSLAYCHVHRKLADIQNMCEGCLLSFATEKECDNDTHKTLLQKDNNNVYIEDNKKVLSPFKTANDNYNSYNYNYNSDGLLEVRMCSCCGVTLKTSASSKGFARSFSNLRASALAATSSPKALLAALSPRACFTSTTWKTEDSRFKELIFISDTEQDVPQYDFGLSPNAKNVKDMKSRTMTLLQDSNEMNDESCGTPNLMKSSNFFGISLTDSSADSPRWANKISRKPSFESTDFQSEINEEALENGDLSLQHYKKQVGIDQKTVLKLSMELDEERSAAAVAANNAMAMITRLQAEKAAVQMEALQYQRMMEEHSEYDQEAIQILKDLLAKRDEHVKVMESELECYREKYGELRRVGSDECEADAEEYYQEWRSQSLSSFGEKTESDNSPLESNYVDPMTPFGKDYDDSTSPSGKDDEYGVSHSGRFVENGKENKNDTNESLLDFETEKYQLYSMLKNLENHIQSSSLEDEWDDDEDDDKAQENKATLKREVSFMRERLRALEADSGFLKHTAMTLQKGEKGAQLLTEIAQHLRKMRRSEASEDIINSTDN